MVGVFDDAHFLFKYHVTDDVLLPGTKREY